jgi:hypothetical protein
LQKVFVQSILRTNHTSASSVQRLMVLQINFFARVGLSLSESASRTAAVVPACLQRQVFFTNGS